MTGRKGTYSLQMLFRNPDSAKTVPFYATLYPPASFSEGNHESDEAGRHNKLGILIYLTVCFFPWQSDYGASPGWSRWKQGSKGGKHRDASYSAIINTSYHPLMLVMMKNSIPHRNKRNFCHLEGHPKCCLVSKPQEHILRLSLFTALQLSITKTIKLARSKAHLNWRTLL